MSNLKLREVIKQIRQCKTAAAERAIISKESALIRNAFKSNKEEENNSLVLENEYKEEQVSNGLEDFEIQEDTPELFNSEDNLETENDDQGFSSFKNEELNEEEDELEIPAFLRRQKN